MFCSSRSVLLFDPGRPASGPRAARSARRTVCLGFASAASLVALALPASSLADGTVPLGTADSFAVLGGSAVTNTGPSLINGDLGVYPGTSVTGFSSAPTDGKVNGTVHAADATAGQAAADIANAYGVAARQAPTAPEAVAPTDVGGQTLTAGVYKYDSSAGLTGTLTLDGQGRTDGVFIFQIGSTLTTATASHVSFINGAQPCHVFWQVGTSATLGSDSVFVGNILAGASVTIGDSVTVQGRALAGTGDVTLINDTINRADCAIPTPPDTGSTPGTPVTGGTPVTTGGTPLGSTNTSSAGKRRQAAARARAHAKAVATAKAKARAKAQAKARATARRRAAARARARARAHRGSSARPPTPTNSRSFTG